jgi:signal transduction histidine kinase
MLMMCWTWDCPGQESEQLKSAVSNAPSAAARLPLLQELIDALWDRDNEEARKYLDLLLRDANRTGAPGFLGYGQERLGGLAYMNGNLDSARAAYNLAYAHYISAGNPVSALKVRTRVGIMHSLEGNYAPAEAIYREVLARADSLPEAKAFAWNQMGTLYHYQGWADSATHYYHQSALAYEQLRDTAGMLRPMYNRAVLLNEMGLAEEAASVLHRVEAIQLQRGAIHDLILTTHALSDHYRISGDLKRAMDYARASYDYALGVGQEQRKVSALISLARISSTNQDTSTSIQYLMEGLEIATKTSNMQQLQTLHYYLSSIFLAQGSYDKAITTIEEGLAITGAHTQSRLKPWLFTNLGMAYLRTARYTEARHMLSEAVDMADQMQNHEAAAMARNYMAESYLLTGQPARAFEIARLAYDQHHPYIQASANLELAATLHAAAKSLGRWEEALGYHELLKYLHDSIHNTEKVRQLTIESRDYAFQLEKQQLEADQLRREAVLKEQALRNRIVSLSIALLAFVLLGFFWQSRRKNRIISDKNLQLAQLNFTKDRLFAIIGHDLRKPAIAFRGIARKVNYLLRKQDFETLHALGDQIEENARALNQLTDNLLHWALTQKNVLVVKPEPLSADVEADTVIQLLLPAAHLKNITFDNAIPPGLRILADRDCLHTILRNLLDNALKYSPEESPITLKAKATDQVQVLIQIIDKGIGMSPSQVQQLFELGQDKSTPGTHGEKGTGLGLHLVQELVHLQDGDIQVISRQGEGTTFNLLFPAAHTPPT